MSNKKIYLEINPDISDLVEQNEGYCPCAIEKTADTICPCKEFREQESGVCTCGRYKVYEVRK